MNRKSIASDEKGSGKTSLFDDHPLIEYITVPISELRAAEAKAVEIAEEVWRKNHVKPIRIQRKRTKGFKLQAASPNGLPVIYCGRPTKRGNRWTLKKALEFGVPISHVM